MRILIITTHKLIDDDDDDNDDDNDDDDDGCCDVKYLVLVPLSYFLLSSRRLIQAYPQTTPKPYLHQRSLSIDFPKLTKVSNRRFASRASSQN